VRLWHLYWILFTKILLISCSHRTAQTPPLPIIPLTPVPSGTEKTPDAKQVEPTVVTIEDMRRAQDLVARAAKHFERGGYDDAEELLKSAITISPFIAEANLILGKIFLVKGAAVRDRTMITNARLMFEMAKTLDPSLREAQMLLELFSQSGDDIK